jgi:plastocyanin
MKKLIGSKSSLLISAGFLFTVLSLTNSCSKSSTSDTTSTPGANEVWIQSYAFNPTTITVKAGTTITWTNKDGVAHTVTPNTGVTEVFSSGTINTNGTFSHMFSTPGTFPYHCSVHPAMTATVVVN